MHRLILIVATIIFTVAPLAAQEEKNTSISEATVFGQARPWFLIQTALPIAFSMFRRAFVEIHGSHSAK